MGCIGRGPGGNIAAGFCPFWPCCCCCIMGTSIGTGTVPGGNIAVGGCPLCVGCCPCCISGTSIGIGTVPGANTPGGDPAWGAAWPCIRERSIGGRGTTSPFIDNDTGAADLGAALSLPFFAASWLFFSSYLLTRVSSICETHNSHSSLV